MKPILCTLLGLTLLLSAEEMVQRTLGKFELRGDSIRFSIIQKGKEPKMISLYVSDEHSINDILFMGTPAEMKDLQKKLAAVIKEAEKP